ncbi:MAG: nitroreductase family protein [Desulfovibrionaceae bacterium]|nr:nitroreductase family protein [Desulfovibrionaceae bacterium]
MDFHALVNEARTCRRFVEDRPLGMGDLEWLIDCARLTPSARNAQVLRYIPVADAAMRERLFPLTCWAGALKDWGGPFPGERPTGFIAVLLPQDAGKLAWVDAGIACQTIQLAATSRGWGCCIIASFDHARVPELLNVPEGMVPALVLGLGVAREERAVAPLPPDGSLTYWRDAEGRHFVPKRPLDEVIVRRF